MIKLTFKRRAAAEAFASMGTSMWETHRDDRDASFATWDAFTERFSAQLPATGGPDKGPVVVELDDRFMKVVEDVRVNCDDNAHEMGVDDEHDLDEHPELAEMSCASFDLVVERDGEPIERDRLGAMTSAEALALLIEVAELTGRPERERTVRAAIEIATMIVNQKGCEHFDAACNGSLTSLMGIVMFG
jgi:hypothetical protein